MSGSQGGCFSFLKFLVFLINFKIWLLGLGVLGVSLWLMFDSSLYLQTSADQHTDYYLATYIFLGVGALIAVMGFLGCCGAWKQSAWMLGTFFAFLLIVFFVEIALGVMLYFNGTPMNEFVKKSVSQTVKYNYNSNNTAAMKTFDMVQEGLECCGSDGVDSWYKSVFNEYDFQVEELGLATKTKSYYNVPRSCCRIQESVDCNNNINIALKQIPSQAALYTDGCVEELTKLLDDHLIYILGAVGGLALLQLLGMMFSLCLCCAVKRIEDMKA